MKKLKILMLGWEFPPLINGGLGIACLGMAKGLSKFADVSVILPKTDPSFIVDNVQLIGVNNLVLDEINSQTIIEEYESFSKVDIIDTQIFPYHIDEQSTSTTSTTKNRIQNIITSKEELDIFKFDELYGEDVNNKVIQFSKIAAKIAVQKDFDIIHVNDWMTFLAGVEIKKYTGKPLAAHVHSLAYDRSGPQSRGWLYDLEKYGMEQADIVMPVSNYTGMICSNHYGVDSSKIFPIHNGALEVKPFKKENAFPEKLVLFLGRITEQKGPEIFLDIASKVMETNKNVRFVMAGTGDRLKRLIESGAYKHVGNKFHFTGFLDKNKVNRLLSMSDIYCMPSVSEPFGLSALEAAQFGIPTVISKQSGVAEVLKDALKADYWDVNLMAENINKLLNDEKLYAKVVASGYEDLEELTWDKSAEKMISIFKNYLQ